MLALLLACSAPPGPDADSAGSSDSAGGVDTGATADTAAAASSTLVLCGGGSEGNEGDRSAWSAEAYARILDGGDVTGDGLVRVAVLAASEESEWIPDYLEWLGADEAFNLAISRRAQADDAALSATFAHVDAVFIKGGDQGEYYDAWNATVLEEAVRAVHARGGGVGGTSAGAMSMSEYALAGGNDYVSADVLVNSHTSYLRDVSDGGPGVHGDFLGFLPGTLVDTHFVVRGRLARLAGAMALAIDEGAPPGVLGIGLDEQTCLVVANDVGEVIGVGTASFLQSSGEAAVRVAGEPLVWPALRLDRLTHGWRWDFVAATPDTAAPPSAALPVMPESDTAQGAEEWSASGSRRADEERFGVVIETEPYAARAGTDAPLLLNAFGLLDAHDSERRGVNDELAFRTLYEHPEATAFLVGDGGALSRNAGSPEEVRIGGAGVEAIATLVISAIDATWRSLAPMPSPADGGDGSLHAAGLVGMRLHILFGPAEAPAVWSMAADSPTP